MGIQGLFPFLRELCPQAFSTVPLESFRGQKIAIDISITICATRARIYKSVLGQTNLLETKGIVNIQEVDAHTVATVVSKIISYREKYGILPLVIFDGEGSVAKNEHAKKRNELKHERSKERLAEVRAEILTLTDIPEQYALYGKFYSRLAECWYETFDKPALESRIRKKLLEAKIPVLNAHGEADALCAALFLEGRVQAVYSKDSDLLPRGCTNLIISIEANEDRVKVAEVCTFGPADIRALGLTQEQFLELCIASGCDYNDRIPKMGPTTLYKKVYQHYRSIRDYCESKGGSYECLNLDESLKLFRYQPSLKIGGWPVRRRAPRNEEGE